jgi:hypothetical protein
MVTTFGLRAAVNYLEVYKRIILIKMRHLIQTYQPVRALQHPCLVMLSDNPGHLTTVSTKIWRHGGTNFAGLEVSLAHGMVDC